MSPSSFHLSFRLGACGRVPGWLVSHFLSFVSHFFSLVSQFFSFVSQAGCFWSGSRLACLPLPFICLLFFPALDCCVRLCLAILYWAAVSASPLQSLILHVSPSSDCCVRLCLAILYMCPRKPLHLSPSRLHICLPVSTFVSQLWTAVAASALQSFVSQLWTSQAAECSDSKNTNCLGSTVV